MPEIKETFPHKVQVIENCWIPMADGYSNAVLRLLSHLEVPRKGLIGPWAHVFPHDSIPGPAIGFLQEALRWWDYWLKGKNNGIMNEPMLRVWMQESPAAAFLSTSAWSLDR